MLQLLKRLKHCFKKRHPPDKSEFSIFFEYPVYVYIQDVPRNYDHDFSGTSDDLTKIILNKI